MSVITDILKEIPLSPILRERLIDQAIHFEREMTILKTENASLKEKIVELESENVVLKAENKNLGTEKDILAAKLEAVIRQNNEDNAKTRPSKQEIHYDIFHKG